MRKYPIWHNCPITNKNSEILRGWAIGSENHTGLDVKCTDVFSICNGVVLQVGQSTNNTYSCIVQYSSKQCVKYSNLFTLDVVAGQLLTAGYYIGKCKSFVHFEYLISMQTDPVFPVRVGTQTYFKVDPQCIVDGSILLSKSSYLT